MKNLIKRYKKTCSIFDIEDQSITFAKNEKNLNELMDVELDIAVLVPDKIEDSKLNDFSNKIKFIKVSSDNLLFEFAFLHNNINSDTFPKDNIIGEGCNIHETVVIGADGLNIAENSSGDRVFIKHIGNVIIGSGVFIDGYTVIHRSIFSSTMIGNDSVISTHVNIAHNCTIGDKTFIGPGVKIAGSVNIGNNCTIWQGALIKNGINICDNVTIGMGSVVTRDILNPGIYYGSPCKMVKKVE